MEYKINYKGKEIIIEKLPSGKFKKPDFVNNLRGAYGGLQKKPAVEVVLCVMKPLSCKSYTEQAMDNGKGCTWLDDVRIPFESEDDKWDGRQNVKMETGNNICYGKYNDTDTTPNTKGRFPANLISSDDVLNSGEVFKTGCGHNSNKIRTTKKDDGSFLDKSSYPLNPLCIGDSGSYNRYFDVDRWWLGVIDKLPDNVKKVFPFLIVPKPSKSEKNKGCEKLEKRNVNPAGLVVAIESGKEKPREERANHHPTCKPIKLFSYMITLGSRKGDVILDPFCGSGTSLVSAKILERDYIGIELDPGYIEIAEARLKGQEVQLKLFD